jgi:hypothetical protein
MMKRNFPLLTLVLTAATITLLVCPITTFAQRGRGTRKPRPQAPAKKESATAAPIPPSAVPVPRCTLDLAHSPELRGFRLGMTVEQVLARVPKLRAQLTETYTAMNNKDGWDYTEINSDDLPPDDREYFNQGRIDFVDGRLSYIEIGYTQVSNNLKDFTYMIAKNFDLPHVWRTSQSMSGLKAVVGTRKERREPLESATLYCNGFRVSTMIEFEFLGGSRELPYWSPHVQIEDTVAAQLLVKRRKENDERERDKFKP